MYDTVVSGCSFTAANFKSHAAPDVDTSWPKWPELLGNEMGWSVLNVAKSGYSNERICEEAIEAIKENSNIKRCIIAASGWTRFSLFGYNFMWDFIMQKETGLEVMKLWGDEDPETNPIYLKQTRDLKEIVRLVEVKEEKAYRHSLKKQLYALDYLRLVCKQRNIELYFFQMLPIVNHLFIDRYNIKQQVLNSYEYKTMKRECKFIKRYDSLHENNIILMSFSDKKLCDKDLRVSEYDQHPNKLCHELIALWLKEEING